MVDFADVAPGTVNVSTGVVMRWLCGVMVLCCVMPTYGMSWKDLWYNNQQQAIQAYRAGDYKTAERRFERDKDARGYYNQGNALAQQKQLQQAIKAYDKALQLSPTMADAQYNRALVETLLQKQQQKQQKNQQKSGQKGQQNAANQGQNQSQSSASRSEQKRAENQTQSPQEGTQAQLNQAQQSSEAKSKQTQSDAQDQSEPKPMSADKASHPSRANNTSSKAREQQQMAQQLLRQIPDDPGGLLRRKFYRDYQRRQMESRGW